MNINVTQSPVGLNGEPMKYSGIDRVVILREIIISSLTKIDPREKISGEDKVRRAKLAERVYKNDVVNLNAEELSLIKLLIGETYDPVTVYRAWEILDPSAEN